MKKKMKKVFEKWIKYLNLSLQARDFLVLLILSILDIGIIIKNKMY